MHYRLQCQEILGRIQQGWRDVVDEAPDVLGGSIDISLEMHHRVTALQNTNVPYQVSCLNVLSDLNHVIAADLSVIDDDSRIRLLDNAAHVFVK